MVDPEATRFGATFRVGGDTPATRFLEVCKSRNRDCRTLLPPTRTSHFNHVVHVVGLFCVVLISCREHPRSFGNTFRVQHESELIITVPAPIKTEVWLFVGKGLDFQFLSLIIA